MLLNNLYQLMLFEANAEKSLNARIRLIKEHPIFEGHFPGNPILPGVCTVQIVKELLEKLVNRELMLNKAGNIKYLGFINPMATAEVQFGLIISDSENGGISCSATVTAGGNVVCSFKGEYFPLSSSHIQQ